VVDAKGLDEVPAADDIKTTDRELAIARQLVDSLSEPFEPERYHDTYREQVLDLIERKAAGEEIAVQPAREESDAPVPDLMSALKASLDAVRERTGGDGDGDGAATKKRAPARKRSGTGSSSGGSSSGGSNGTRKAPAKKPSSGRKATAKKS
jgi:DNA end-binding protein Ku